MSIVPKSPPQNTTKIIKTIAPPPRSQSRRQHCWPQRKQWWLRSGALLLLFLGWIGMIPNHLTPRRRNTLLWMWHNNNNNYHDTTNETTSNDLWRYVPHVSMEWGPQQEQQQQDSFSSTRTKTTTDGTVATAIKGGRGGDDDDNDASPAVAAAAPWLQNRTLTLLVLLRGELCNHLSVLAQAKRIQRYVERALPGLSLHLVGQHQNHSRWTRAATDIYECFPGLEDLELSGGIYDPTHFGPVQQAQQTWLTTAHKAAAAAASSRSPPPHPPTTTNHSDDVLCPLQNVKTVSQIKFLQNLLKQQYQAKQEQQQQQNGRRSSMSFPVPLPSSFSNNPYSIPFLTVTEMLSPQLILEKDDNLLYHELRHWFRMRPSCCPLRADPNETIFHFRNFVTEVAKPLPRHEHLLGELSPHDAAHYLLGRPPPPSSSNNPQATNRSRHNSSIMNQQSANTTTNSQNRLAILSRFPKTALPHAHTLQAHGWNVRLIANQSGVQDFCFALSTQATFVGFSKSTYAWWAGLLSNATLVRWYKTVPAGDDKATTTSNNDDTKNMTNRNQRSRLVPTSLSSSSHIKNNKSETIDYESTTHHLATTNASGLLQKRTLLKKLDPLSFSSSSSSSLSEDEPSFSSSSLQQPREFWTEVYRQSESMTFQSLKQESKALLRATTATTGTKRGLFPRVVSQ